MSAGDNVGDAATWNTGGAIATLEKKTHDLAGNEYGKLTYGGSQSTPIDHHPVLTIPTFRSAIEVVLALPEMQEEGLDGQSDYDAEHMGYPEADREPYLHHVRQATRDLFREQLRSKLEGMK